MVNVARKLVKKNGFIQPQQEQDLSKMVKTAQQTTTKIPASEHQQQSLSIDNFQEKVNPWNGSRVENRPHLCGDLMGRRSIKVSSNSINLHTQITALKT